MVEDHLVYKIMDNETPKTEDVTPVAPEQVSEATLPIAEEVDRGVPYNVLIIDEAKPAGRPSIFTEELSESICELISQGWSVRKICEMEEMPHMDTIFSWLAKNKTFSEQYSRAKEHSAEYDNERLAELGDEAIDMSMKVDPKAAGAVVSAYKLKADNMRWSMGKKKPKKYGDKVDVTSGGEAIKGNTVVFTDFKPNAADSQPGV